MSNQQIKILIPIANFADINRLMDGLRILSVFQNPLIVLFNVLEISSRTIPLDPAIHVDSIRIVEGRLGPLANWLKKVGYDVEVKVIVSRDVAEGIVMEAESGGYSLILMMKRRLRKGFAAIFSKSISESVIQSTKCMVLTTLVDYR